MLSLLGLFMLCFQELIHNCCMGSDWGKSNRSFKSTGKSNVSVNKCSIVDEKDILGYSVGLLNNFKFLYNHVITGVNWLSVFHSFYKTRQFFEAILSRQPMYPVGSVKKICRCQTVLTSNVLFQFSFKLLVVSLCYQLNCLLTLLLYHYSQLTLLLLSGSAFNNYVHLVFCRRHRSFA